MPKDGKIFFGIFYRIWNQAEIPDTHEIYRIYSSKEKYIKTMLLKVISELYKQLLKIEQEEGIDASEKYLINFLKEKGEDIEFSHIMEEIHKFY